MKDIIIFGGGISGLTVAHEMIKKGFNVTLIEKDICLGGMAKTRWESNNTPSEHSWRGWSNTYSNAFRIMKEIPYNEILYPENKTIFDNLTKDITFFEFNDSLPTDSSKYTISDSVQILNDSVKFLTSDKRKDYFYTINAAEYYKDKLSNKGYDFIINCVQTAGFGMENKDGSLGHFLKLLTEGYSHPFEYYKNNDQGRIDLWRLLNQPTNDGWFNPWKKYLTDNGVNIILNTELNEIITEKYDSDKILYVSIKDNNSNTIYTLKADEYVFAINPFNLEEILKKNSSDNKYINQLYHQHKNMNEKTDSRQISFRIGINKDIDYTLDRIGIVLSGENNYNMTFYPQNKHWKEYNNMNIPYKTLWSGTLMNTKNNGIVYNKPSLQLNIEQLKDEIKQQIISSKSFQNMIYKHNNFYLDLNDIEYIEVWYEWNVNPETKLLQQDYKKWVNNTYNEKFRPTQQTLFDNLVLAGSHTKTTMVIYSMEGAVESGLIASNIILEKYDQQKTPIFNHTEATWIKPLQSIDNILYSAKMPNIISVVTILLIIFIIFYINSFLY